MRCKKKFNRFKLKKKIDDGTLGFLQSEPLGKEGSPHELSLAGLLCFRFEAMVSETIQEKTT